MGTETASAPMSSAGTLTSTVVTVPPPGIYRVLGINSASTLACLLVLRAPPTSAAL